MPAAETCVVAVVGAGPAGCLVAASLARARPDLRVVLLEAATAAAPRACGEFLARAGAAVLSRAGLLDQATAGAQSLAGLALCAGRARLLDGDGGGYGIRRERFDAALRCAAEQAGAELRPGWRVEALSRDGGGWRLEGAHGALTARILIGADGRGSRVRRAAGLTMPDPRRRMALACRAQGIRPPAGALRGEMHLSPLGQVGIAWLGDGEANVNLLLAADAVPLLRRLGAPALLRIALRTTPSLTARAAGARIGAPLLTGQLCCRSRRAAVGSAALVGDAAGFHDPVTGDGITLALIAAERLAARLAAWRDGDPDPHLAAYAGDWRRLDRRKALAMRLILPLLDRRGLAAAAVSALARVPWLGERMLRAAGASPRLCASPGAAGPECASTGNVSGCGPAVAG